MKANGKLPTSLAYVPSLLRAQMTANNRLQLHEEQPRQPANMALPVAASLGGYALSGGAALLLLSLLEFIDLNISSRVVLGSISTRLTLFAFSTLNVRDADESKYVFSTLGGDADDE